MAHLVPLSDVNYRMFLHSQKRFHFRFSKGVNSLKKNIWFSVCCVLERGLLSLIKYVCVCFVKNGLHDLIILLMLFKILASSYEDFCTIFENSRSAPISYW